MMRRLPLAGLFLLAPAGAWAGTMPQMEFHNPLTGTQVIWMVVILAALYLVLDRWGLPQVGGVLGNRAAIIAANLAAAKMAKQAADDTAHEMNSTLKAARQTAQAEIAKAVTEAKAKASAEAAALNAALDAKLADSEAQIEVARQKALAAIKPVALDATAAILQRLIGGVPDEAALSGHVDDAIRSKAA